MRFVAFFLLLIALPVLADEQVSICYNYGCRAHAEIVYGGEQLRILGKIMGRAHNAAEERQAISLAVGRLLDWAGKQSPIWADRGGNAEDGGVDGEMDCIDHSTTTTRLLQMMDRLGLLRYHRVRSVARRTRFVLFEHFAAQIEEIEAEKTNMGNAGKTEDASTDESNTAPRYVVDSWFFNNGHPAEVMPLARWLAGEGPEVGN